MSEPVEPRAARQWRKLLADGTTLLVLFAIVLGTWHVVSPRSSPLNFLLARERLPAVPVGGGHHRQFTELNRHRPDGAGCFIRCLAICRPASVRFPPANCAKRIAGASFSKLWSWT